MVIVATVPMNEAGRAWTIFETRQTLSWSWWRVTARELVGQLARSSTGCHINVVRSLTTLENDERYVVAALYSRCFARTRVTNPCATADGKPEKEGNKKVRVLAWAELGKKQGVQSQADRLSRKMLTASKTEFTCL